MCYLWFANPTLNYNYSTNLHNASVINKDIWTVQTGKWHSKIPELIQMRTSFIPTTPNKNGDSLVKHSNHLCSKSWLISLQLTTFFTSANKFPLWTLHTFNSQSVRGHVTKPTLIKYYKMMFRNGKNETTLEGIVWSLNLKYFENGNKSLSK